MPEVLFLKNFEEVSMARERLSVRKIREVLRLKWIGGFSNRQTAESCCVSHSTVAEYLFRAELAGLSWPLDPDLDDAAIESLLFPATKSPVTAERQMPDMEYLFRELKKKSVTLQLLWHEHKQINPDGYQYSQFCNHYRQWAKKLDVTLRQEHRAGEKLFVDYAGQKVPIINGSTGTIIEAQIFLATLGASNYTYAEASLSQNLPSWIGSHVRAFDFFDGVAAILVPDNLKTGVNHPCRYEPDVNPTYQDLAQHYGAVVIPARPGKARDKG
jgi:transposase